MIKDAGRSYGWLSIGLHWTAAILVLVLFFNGRALEGAADPATRAAEAATHLAIGGYALIFLLVRFGWRASNRLPRTGGVSPTWLDRLGALILWALVSSTALLALTGAAIQWLGGEPATLPAGTGIPSPFAADAAARESMLASHDMLADLIAPLFILHLLGALKHVMTDNIEGFLRMIRPSPSDQATDGPGSV